jgi:hypothetical protein
VLYNPGGGESETSPKCENRDGHNRRQQCSEESADTFSSIESNNPLILIEQSIIVLKKYTIYKLMFFKLSQLLSFSISLFATSVASEYQDQISIESCHEDGFDPVQLACPTCDILPESVDSKCRACCQPYKTVKTQTKRYACAVLLHHDEQGMMPEIDQVYNEEVDNIQKRKGKNGFWTKTMTLGNFYRPSP